MARSCVATGTTTVFWSRQCNGTPESKSNQGILLLRTGSVREIHERRERDCFVFRRKRFRYPTCTQHSLSRLFRHDFTQKTCQLVEVVERRSARTVTPMFVTVSSSTMDGRPFLSSSRWSVGSLFRERPAPLRETCHHFRKRSDANARCEFRVRVVSLVYIKFPQIGHTRVYGGVQVDLSVVARCVFVFDFPGTTRGRVQSPC